MALAQLSFGDQRNGFVDFCNQATHLRGWDIVAVVPNFTYFSGALCVLYRLCYNNNKLSSSACNPAIEDLIMAPRHKAMRHMAVNFSRYQSQLTAKLQSAASKVHVLSDLWTCPHGHGVLAICARWLGCHTGDNATSNDTGLQHLLIRIKRHLEVWLVLDTARAAFSLLFVQPALHR
ncbi:hypothetical protein X797_011240 [Metarhizium robertsii]|uniref:Uncharacterized protein n=1 Tax=Metarhizium robertsii TaxID=568076 RepID=A0A014MWI7_9HYPO|nr:hypothetical protein X797_011240 [Metarhizium robertsii]